MGYPIMIGNKRKSHNHSKHVCYISNLPQTEQIPADTQTRWFNCHFHVGLLLFKSWLFLFFVPLNHLCQIRGREVLNDKGDFLTWLKKMKIVLVKMKVAKQLIILLLSLSQRIRE